MKLKTFGLIILLMAILFIIPISFASSIPDVELNSSLELESDYVDSNYLNENSYFDGNNSFEEPMLDDDFSNVKISFTDRNTFYVNSSYEGTNELGTVDNPYKNIESAFSNLNFNRSVTNIYIAHGHYNVSNTIGFTKNLNIIGENPLNTIISGKNLSEIFLVSKNGLNVNFINLTFTQGNNYYGGAIYNNRSSVKLINDIFRENYAVGFSQGQVAYSAAGGAIYNEAGTCKIYNSTFIDNVAKSSLNVYGGAIYNELGMVSLLHSRFINNIVDDANYGSGGAIYNYNGYLTIFNSTFDNNTIKSNYSIGGAIYNYEGHNVYVINSTFSSNKIYGNYTFGSAIANSAILLEVVNSTFYDNLANGTALENTTVFNLNGYYNFINSTMFNNTVAGPKENIFMCLEDQFIISRAFDESLLQNLPSKYDLRDEGWVTYAKNQGSSGACWAFTTIAALESYLLKYENLSYDLSENNLKNLMNYKGINGTDWPDGGNYQMALAYFLRWDGPIDEDDDVFSAYSIIPNYDSTPQKHVQGAMFLPMRMGDLDIGQIKYAIMKYGALYASIYGTSMTKNIYNSIGEIPNHAVTIVGWDDNYPSTRFLGIKPPGNGAFIIKNSWGTSYGDKGFGYVSYYDKTFAGMSLDSLSSMAFTDVENVTNYKDIYQYDILGNTYESLGFGCSTAYMANQFTAVSDNPLSAFGFYTYGSSDYLVDVYVNGDLKYTQQGKVGYAGYHTIKLERLVNLLKGDVFRLNVRLTTPDSMFPIAIESARNGYSSKATSDINQSFVSVDGINWQDIGQDFEIIKVSGCFYNKTLEKANVCLKAYTSNIGNLQLNISSNSSFFFKGDEIRFLFNLTNIGDYVSGVNLSFNLDSMVEVVEFNATKGIFNGGIWTIDDVYSNESIILCLTVKINENELITNKVSINSIDDIKNNDESIIFNLTYAGFTEFFVNDMTSLSKSGDEVSILLTDMMSNPVSNVDVIINVDDGKNVSLKSDEKGIIKFNIDLLEGLHVCNVYFKGNLIYCPTNATFNINVSKRTSKLVNNTTSFVFFYGEDVTVILTDENNNSLVNKSVIFDNGVESFLATTNDKGFASISCLKSGNHTIRSSFGGDDLYYASECIFNVSIIKKDTFLTANNIKTSAIVVAVDKRTGPYLKVTLKDDYNSLSNKSIQIKFGSHTYSLITNKDGVASLQINIAKSGTYSLQAKFLGDDEYKNSSVSSKVVITKKKMSLNVPKKTYKSSKKVKTLTATLKDNKGKLISSKKIYFKVNGKTYSAKTNKKGIAIVKVKITKKKTYTVSVSFKGDNSYAKVTKKAKLIIK